MYILVGALARPVLGGRLPGARRRAVVLIIDTCIYIYIYIYMSYLYVHMHICTCV